MAFESLVAPLFVPATRPERFGKAATSGADAIIIDLEDAVPGEMKDKARGNLAENASFDVPTLIRINGTGTPWFDADMAALSMTGTVNVCVPKVESPELIDIVVASLGAEVRVLAQIETAKGLQRASEIAAHPNVFQLAFGPADFFLDLGTPASAQLTTHALATMAVASRASRKPLPLDGPAFSVNDHGAVAEECALAASSGAGGKLCIHPAQVRAVLQAFAPTEKEQDWARRVIAADKDGAAIVVDGQMIDAPVVARARQVLSRASQASDGRRPS